MITKEDIQKAIELDDAASKLGGYVDYGKPLPPYRIREMIKWARRNDKNIETLTEKEREQFLIKEIDL